MVATHQTASLWGKLNRASLPRPQVRAGALNLGDNSGRYEDLITTERSFGCQGDKRELGEEKHDRAE